MEVLRAERKACQEQLSQHAETARALQVRIYVDRW